MMRAPAVAALLLGVACTAVVPRGTPAEAVNTAEMAIAPDRVADSLLVDIRMIEPAIIVEMRYFTADNFTGAPLPGYLANRAYLRREAAAALARVQRGLRESGLGLKVFDGYRPARATQAMMDWTTRAGRADLLRDGYIASRSRHNLGLAIDLTLIELGTGRELGMGTPFDTFTAAAHTANATGSVAANRQLLKAAMERQEFTNYDQEWWHFSFSVPDPLRFDWAVR